MAQLNYKTLISYRIGATKLWSSGTVKSYGELRRATESYRELWSATESYGELWVPMVKTNYLKFIFYWLRATESYGELQTAKQSY